MTDKSEKPVLWIVEPPRRDERAMHDVGCRKRRCYGCSAVAKQFFLARAGALLKAVEEYRARVPADELP